MMGAQCPDHETALCSYATAPAGILRCTLTQDTQFKFRLEALAYLVTSVHHSSMLCDDCGGIITTESRGRVVTRWPGSQEVGGLIPGCATKFVRCKNLAFNIGECVSRGSDTM